MSRTLLAGLALIGLAACGGHKGRPAAHTRSSAAAARSAATRPTTRKAQHKTTARSDTAGQRNPLTNH